MNDPFPDLSAAEIARRLAQPPDLPAAAFDLSEEELVRRLAGAQDRPPPSPSSIYPPGLLPLDPRPAAVLIPFLRMDDAWHILFTRRTDNLPEHSGQVAFPGGRADSEDESPEMTALRETCEEIDLQPADVRILGRLNPLLTISNYCITPVVGVIPWPYPLKLAEVEVSRAFTIPLVWLSRPENHEIRPRLLPPPYPPVPVVYFQRYDGELLWGVSAQITLDLLAALQSTTG